MLIVYSVGCDYKLISRWTENEAEKDRQLFAYNLKT